MKTDETRTILLVDDEPLVIEFISEMLQEEGYNVLSAQTALGATQILLYNPIDVLICDLRLGQDDGIAVIESALKRQPTCKINAISGFTPLIDRCRSVVPNCQVIEKPFRKVDLVSAIGVNYPTPATSSSSLDLNSIVFF